MFCESLDVVRFDLEPLVQGQTRMAKLKSAYILLIIGPRGLECVTNLYKFMCWESFAVVRFDLGPLRSYHCSGLVCKLIVPMNFHALENFFGFMDLGLKISE